MRGPSPFWDSAVCADARAVIGRAVGWLCMVALVGCAFPIPVENGTTNYLIVGVGVVSVASESNAKSVTAIRHKSIGLTVSNASNIRMAVGFDSGQMMRVDEGARDVRVELEERTDGKILMNVQSVDFN